MSDDRDDTSARLMGELDSAITAKITHDLGGNGAIVTAWVLIAASMDADGTPRTGVLHPVMIDWHVRGLVEYTLSSIKRNQHGTDPVE